MVIKLSSKPPTGAITSLCSLAEWQHYFHVNSIMLAIRRLNGSSFNCFCLTDENR